jgi:hypothetical protein
MAHNSLETAVLFTPGRASYVTSGLEGTFDLNLTEASSHRAEVAAELFDPNVHSGALFAGGYPGIAQSWPPEHTPAIDNREANLMAQPLKARLTREGWFPDDIATSVKEQGTSNNSIGDVLISIEKGFLDPNDFHSDSTRHGIHLVAGVLHGIRFHDILTKALDIDSQRIVRANIHDPYGTPATEFRPKELPPIAIAKECAAIAINKMILRDVRPGNIEDLRDAEQRFNAFAAKGSK